MRYTWIVLPLVLSGCSLIPKYDRPQLPVPATFAAATNASPAALSTADWRTTFADPRLQSVIERALASNRDLRIAALNAERAAATYRIRRADLYPSLEAAAVGDRSRVPASLSSTGHAYTSGQYSVTVGIPSWELDFFGRIRSLNDAALHQYLATEHARAATELSLVSSVATSYLHLAADDESLKIAQSTLAADESSLDLIVRRRDLGVGTDVDVNEARSLVETARADVAALEGDVHADESNLSLLVGEPVSAELLPGTLATVEPIAAIEAGISSDVLLQRPDILAAEQSLIAANANIGAARAAFFPNISLTAAAGTLSPAVSNLFASGSATWSFQPQISVPIFSAGSPRANLAATRTSRDIAVAEYEKAIQRAFAEVSNALTDRTALTKQVGAVEALVSTLEETKRLTTARYDAGLDSYLRVLVAERSLFAARQQLVALRLAEQNNRITLFKVLAGEGPAKGTS